MAQRSLDKDSWFSPSELSFFSLDSLEGGSDDPVIVMELRSADGNFGIAPIPGQGSRIVVPRAAKLANQLRSTKVNTEYDVRLLPEEVNLDPPNIVALSALRTALADALARTSQLPLHEYLRKRAGLDTAGKREATVSLTKSVSYNGSADDKKYAERFYTNFPTDARPIRIAEVKEQLIRTGSSFMEVCLQGLRGTSRVQISRATEETSLSREFETVDLLSEYGVQRMDYTANNLSDEELRSLSERSDLDIGYGCRTYGVENFRRFLWQKLASVFTVNASYAGGVEEARRILTTVRASSSSSVGSRVTSDSDILSVLTGAHLAMADAPEEATLEYGPVDSPGSPPVGISMLNNAPTIADNVLMMSSKAGLGVSVNHDFVESHGKRWSL